MKFDPYPSVRDEVKSHALAITVGRFLNTATLIQNLTLEDWLCYLAIVIDTEIKKELERARAPHPEMPQMHDSPILAQQLILRWKNDQTIRERFVSLADYSIAIDEMLSGSLKFEPTLFP